MVGEELKSLTDTFQYHHLNPQTSFALSLECGFSLQESTLSGTKSKKIQAGFAQNLSEKKKIRDVEMVTEM